MKMKEGMSGIVAVVFLVFLVVVVTVTVYIFVFSEVDEGISSSNFEDVELEIVDREGYTYYDPDLKVASVQVWNGDEIDVDYVDIIFLLSDGNSVTVRVEAPEPNSAKVYDFNFGWVSAPTSVKIAPVFGNKSEEISSAVFDVLEGEYEGSRDSLYVVKADDPSSSGYSLVEIFNCQKLNDSGVRYILVGDVSFNQGNCFEVLENGISLECNGHKISGKGDSAIFVDADNVKISGCNLELEKAERGIYVKDSDRVYLEENRVSGLGVGLGIEIFGSKNVDLSSNSVLGVKANGYYLHQSNECILKNNTGNENGRKGIWIEDSNNNVLENNSFKKNKINGGIALRNSDNNSIFYNSVVGNKDYGIWLWNSDKNVLKENLISETKEGYARGVYLTESSYNEINCNNFLDNSVDILLNENWYFSENQVGNILRGNGEETVEKWGNSELVVEDGMCAEENRPLNIKDMSKYPQKQAFLISDKNWKEVLPLVPVTTWTQNEEDNSLCNRGYETPENVCVYPTLIYHEEEQTERVDPTEYFYFHIENGIIVQESSDYFDGEESGFVFKIIDNYLYLETTIKEGKIIIPFSYFDEGNLFEVLGKNQTQRLTTSFYNGLTFDLDIDEYFFASWSDEVTGETYLMRVVNLTNEEGIPKATIQTFRDSQWSDILVGGIGDSFSYGKIQFEIGNINMIDNSLDLISINGRFNRIYSNQSYFFVLPESQYFPIEAIFVEVFKTTDSIESYLVQSLDADSIVHFFQQYGSSNLKLIGESPIELDNLLIAQKDFGAGFREDQIERIFPQSYLSYWEYYSDIVYVADNYEISLLASAYASLINAPLIIQGTELDVEENFVGRNVVCVGDVERLCNRSYDLEGLQKKYIEQSNTDKIILVNPFDDEFYSGGKFFPEKSLNSIYQLYSKTSLYSPILASAKQEVIFSIGSPYEKPSFESVDFFIENKIKNLNFLPNYLTIIASPDAIEIYDEKRQEVDYNYYADLNESSGGSELAVGRIMGITLSDVSSLVSRGLFYDKVQLYNNSVMIMLGDPPIQEIPRLVKQKYFCEAYFDKSCPEIFEDYSSFFESSSNCNEDVYNYYDKILTYDYETQKTTLIDEEKYLKVSPLFEEDRIFYSRLGFSNYLNRNFTELNVIYNLNVSSKEVKSLVSCPEEEKIMPIQTDKDLLSFACISSDLTMVSLKEYSLLSNNLISEISLQDLIPGEIITRYSKPGAVYYFDLVLKEGEIIVFLLRTEELDFRESLLFYYNMTSGNVRKIDYDGAANWIVRLNKGNLIFTADLLNEGRTIQGVYVYSFSSENLTLVFQASHISYFDVENNIVGIAASEDYSAENQEIFVYNISSQELKKISKGEKYDALFVYVEDSRLFWEDLEWTPTSLYGDFYLYDLGTEITEKLELDRMYKFYPLIKEDKIFWQNERDLYIYDLKLKSLSKIQEEVSLVYAKLFEDFLVFVDQVPDKIYGREGYEIECLDRRDELVNNVYQSSLVVFADHGLPQGWGYTLYSDELGWLPPTLGFTFACSTCDYGSAKEDLFCANIIRKGAIGYVGSIQPTFGNHYLNEFLDEVLIKDNDLGNAFLIGKNKEQKKEWENLDVESYETEYGVEDILIGDPTLNIFGGKNE